MTAGKTARIFAKMKNEAIGFVQAAEDLGKDDPRRVVHSLKVGLAITLVSLFYYFEPLYDGFGVSAMWAVLTVVVVFEYSVGGTLGKGVNRAVATSLAAMLAVGVHRLATLSGDKALPYFLGLSVFFIAAGVTFLRFFPRLKARYDYGLLIFILTFALISVSGYREEEVLEMAHKRISTIFIGSLTALLICVLVCPVWAGTDLHNHVAHNIEKLGNFLEEFGVEYFGCGSEDGEMSEEKKRYMEGYKTVLDSINNLDSLVKLARWEPRHGRFRYRHPWEQYRNIGAVTRNCACRIEALNGYLHSHIQAPPQVKAKIEDACVQMSSELGKALNELALSIKTMTRPSISSSGSTTSHLQNAKLASENLHSVLKADPWKDISDATCIIPSATVASLLIDVLRCTDDIDVAVQELASQARFKNKNKAPGPYKDHDHGAQSDEGRSDQEKCKKLGKAPKVHKHLPMLKRSSFAKETQYHAVTIKEEEENDDRKVKAASTLKFSKSYKDPASLDMPPHDGE